MENKQENALKIYYSLKNFCLSYEANNYNRLTDYLSKCKLAFDNEQVRIERNILFQKLYQNFFAPVRSIVPVVRKVPLKEVNSAEQDLNFWLQKPSKERIAAVTYLVSQSFKKETKDG